MTASEFVKSINASIPSASELRGAGNGEESVQNLLSRSRIHHSSHSPQASSGKGLIHDLYDQYETNNHCLGFTLQLRPSIRLVDGYSHFMSLEADYIVQDNVTSQIYVMDCYSHELTHKCANDASAFILALVTYVTYCWRLVLGEEISESDRSIIAWECANLASSDPKSCISFYSHIIC